MRVIDSDNDKNSDSEVEEAGQFCDEIIALAQQRDNMNVVLFGLLMAQAGVVTSIAGGDEARSCRLAEGIGKQFTNMVRNRVSQ